MARDEHTKGARRAQTMLATLVMGASLVVAACGTGQAMSGTADRAQGSVLRDPDNPYWTGASTSALVVEGGGRSSVIRDPDNPYWTGADAKAAQVSEPAADPGARGPR